jgi:hypothetical protein
MISLTGKKIDAFQVATSFAFETRGEEFMGALARPILFSALVARVVNRLALPFLFLRTLHSNHVTQHTWHPKVSIIPQR